MLKRLLLPATLVLALAAGWLANDAFATPREPKRAFELRIYHVLPGRMPAMHARFRDHTNRLLTKHGMTLVGFWTPQGADADKTLYYLVAHPSKEAAEKNWKSFVADPDWVTARDASEKDGKIVEKVDRVWLDPTEYSQMK